MKKRKKTKGIRFKAPSYHQSSTPRIVEMEPEDLAIHVRRAEKAVIPIIKEKKLSPAAAQFLLAQHTHVLVTGDPHLTVESATAIANNVIKLWQTGFYTPSSQYPYTLEETLKELLGDKK